jgi:hypothetical protein
MADAPAAPASPSTPAAPGAAPEIPPVERQVAADMIRRSLPALPLLVILAALGWGLAGALSASYAIALVLLNFTVSAVALAWAAPRSLVALMAVALFGFLIRLGFIAAAVLVVKDAAWVELVPLGFTLVITHLGLLIWEARHVSASLAFPGLKPEKG